MPTITAKVTEEMMEQLDQVSSMLDRSRAWVIKAALGQYLNEYLDDMERWQETEQAIHAADAGEVISEKEFTAWLNTWGKPTKKTKK